MCGCVWCAGVIFGVYSPLRCRDGCVADGSGAYLVCVCAGGVLMKEIVWSHPLLRPTPTLCPNCLHQSMCRHRISQLFDIIREYPESTPVLHDLKACLEHTHMVSIGPHMPYHLNSNLFPTPHPPPPPPPLCFSIGSFPLVFLPPCPTHNSVLLDPSPPPPLSMCVHLRQRRTLHVSLRTRLAAPFARACLPCWLPVAPTRAPVSCPSMSAAQALDAVPRLRSQGAPPAPRRRHDPDP